MSFTFIGYKDRYAVLENDFFHEYLWPIEKFPREINPGEKIDLEIKTDSDRKNELYQIKRKLLEELIN
ncbi:hypothetical protein A2229_04875 [Candidatus Peregrinibacteria bacterium RIFOXYA2_FULL_33_7]|nr:MAG: hypothetical protein A2229_04875 [Candidatus Peregrinibacteria bacterium RIFOXYA2_FULL_33_7]